MPNNNKQLRKVIINKRPLHPNLETTILIAKVQ